MRPATAPLIWIVCFVRRSRSNNLCSKAALEWKTSCSEFNIMWHFENEWWQQSDARKQYILTYAKWKLFPIFTLHLWINNSWAHIFEIITNYKKYEIMDFGKRILWITLNHKETSSTPIVKLYGHLYSLVDIKYQE